MDQQLPPPQFVPETALQEAALQTQAELGSEALLRRRIIDHCAPVLAGVKPAALVSFIQDHRKFNLIWNEHRFQFERQRSWSPLEILELRHRPRETAVLFYHPSLLDKVLADSSNRLFLKSLGYLSPDLNHILARIQSRFQEGCPHEIGIVLGIPLWDVAGFITNRGRGYLFNGYWKVYHHPEQALRTFFLYDQTRREARGIYN
jgi:hypothetical protein